MNTTKELKISMLQWDLIWEDPEANLEKLKELLENTPRNALVILPELFTTGFTMNSEALAEEMDGPSLKSLIEMSVKSGNILTGSIIIKDNAQIFNRLLWIQPDGKVYHYDKRHLFDLAGEDQHFSPGSERIITQIANWKILPQVCFDLRFPVWQRNTDDYDLMYVVANWPEQRIDAWTKLLQARAIENQSYVIGVNRIGKDPKGLCYVGKSSIIDPLGNTIYEMSSREEVYTHSLELAYLNEVRQKLPFLQERDNFILL